MASEVLTVISVVGGGTGSLIAKELIEHYKSRRAAKSVHYEQKYKLFYIKAYHLTEKDANVAPVYTVRINRLDKNVDVYDEFHCFEMNVLKSELSNFEWAIRSSGTVDYQLMYPWCELKNTDVRGKKSEGDIVGSINQPSRIFCARSIRYNGFQNEASQCNTDQGMQMTRDTEEARLVVDFTSIPNFDKILAKPPKAILIDDQEAERKIDFSPSQQGIYMLHQTNLKKGCAIRVDFFVDWTATRKPLP